MKCLYSKPCEVKGTDGACNASIKGYCNYQEKPVNPVPEPPKPVVSCLECEAMGSQDAWIEQTKIMEQAGHQK